MNAKASGWIALILTAALLTACGPGGSAQGSEAGVDQPAAGPQPEEMSPAELGEAVGRLYLEAMEAVAKEVAERPEPTVLQPKLQQMKQAYVADLVELGRARESLGAADRATVDGKISMTVNRVPSATFSAYAEGQNHYLKTDRELAELIASFNVITQYANFDLLKKQAPAEAERLGIP